MAITNNNLKTLTFSGNNNVIVATSTNNGQPNFRLSVKVELWDGAAWQLITSQLVPKRPDNNIVYNLEGVFRAIAENNLNASLQTSFVADLSTLYLVRITLQEYYGTTPSLQGSTVEQSIRVLPATYSEYKFPSFVPNDILVGDANGGKLLKIVSGQSLRLDQFFTLEFVHEGMANTPALAIATYDNDGAFIDNFITTGFTAITFRRKSIVATLNTLNSLTLSSGTQPIITNDVHFIEFRVISSLTIGTPPFKVVIDRSCSKHDIHTLFWLNSYGALETLSCTGRPINQYENERETAYLDNGEVSSGDWSETPLKGGETTIYAKQKTVFRLNTGLLIENDIKRLSELGKSREVAIKIGSDLFNCELLTLPFTEDADFPNPTNYTIDVALSKVVEV